MIISNECDKKEKLTKETQTVRDIGGNPTSILGSRVVKSPKGK